MPFYHSSERKLIVTAATGRHISIRASENTKVLAGIVTVFIFRIASTA
jgi:hypothetical protein